jgi:cytoskeletal protein CcmA (bactofilin family)
MMSNPSNATESDSARVSNQSSADAFDTNLYFDRWLQDLQSSQEPSTAEVSEIAEEEKSEIYIGSFPGSNCEVTFEGVLHFDGYSIGNISSPEGTLVLTRRGRIEADINVGVAVINGSVTGNITATQRVVLDSDARVTGRIRTPALSVRLGAIFDGDCLFTAPAEPLRHGVDSMEQQPDEPEHLAVGAGA